MTEELYYTIISILNTELIQPLSRIKHKLNLIEHKLTQAESNLESLKIRINKLENSNHLLDSLPTTDNDNQISNTSSYRSIFKL